MDFTPTYSKTAFDSMFVRGFGDRITPALRVRLKGVGIDLDGSSLAAYLQSDWEQGVTLAAAALFPELSAAEQHFHAGRLYIRGFAETLLGGAVVQLGKLVGPERTLGRMQRNQRTTTNYSALEVHKLSGNHFRIESRVAPEFLPSLRPFPGFDQAEFVRGVYTEVLATLAVKNPRVTCQVLALQELRIDYDLVWDS